jgi:hypothetical protein
VDDGAFVLADPRGDRLRAAARLADLRLVDEDLGIDVDERGDQPRRAVVGDRLAQQAAADAADDLVTARRGRRAVAACRDAEAPVGLLDDDPSLTRRRRNCSVWGMEPTSMASRLPRRPEPMVSMASSSSGSPSGAASRRESFTLRFRP